MKTNENGFSLFYKGKNDFSLKERRAFRWDRENNHNRKLRGMGVTHGGEMRYVIVYRKNKGIKIANRDVRVTGVVNI